MSNETMAQGLQLAAYGLATVFAALVGFAALVIWLRRVIKPGDADNTQGGQP